MITKINTRLNVSVLLSFFLFINMLSSQELVHMTSSPSCENTPTGEIGIMIDGQVFEQDYDLPVEVNWLNSNNNDAGSIILTSYTGSIINLYSGTYVIEITLSDECLLTATISVGVMYPSDQLHLAHWQ